MKIKYNLHVHSGLSPCAEESMTPVTIVGFAAADGLDMVAIADHNAIENVPVALAAGEAYGVTVVPAMELQTEEEIHVLCLFPTYEKLKAFYSSVDFPFVKNREEIFGTQLIFDEDDNVTGKLDRLLAVSSAVSSAEVFALARRFDGIAVPAHIDRDANGMLAILGIVTEEFTAVELSNTAGEAILKQYSETHNILINSDAHSPEQLGTYHTIDLPECSAQALISALLISKKP